MKKRFLIGIIIIIVLAIILLNKPRCLKENIPTGEWELTWQDEFDKDLTKWYVVDGVVKTGSGEIQYYAPEEVFVENGSLKIRSQKRDFKDHQYTSGRISTINSFSQKYGKFEIKAKLPSGKGMFTAFWLMPLKGWNYEIDVFEYLGRNPNTIYMTNIWSTIDIKWLNALTRKRNTEIFEGEDFSKDFHVYSIEWNPNEIIWYIDGEERHRSNKGISCEPMYIIINNAIGGDWAWNPDETTIFPQYFEVDYVKVYERK